ncbi:hypothetical protein RGQ29_020391 [Quercus rubra]|uniref:GDSL esterase/lipase n=1 Tax=Quercus rubra TaxID=3512 RepID=A0AAN7FCX9_QUERU|nr:hypothetical protein RGQ29_020391 [Quercus rubra]
MEFFYKHSLPLLFILQLLCFTSIGQALNGNVTALLVFGDSTVDPGNNNNIRTIFKANFRPYGISFPNQTATGRFSDGQLTTDFAASYLGIKKYIPPYLDPTLSTEELVTGVSFASGASGYDPLTPTLSNVIPMSKQLDYFREYKKKIEPAIGNQGIENHINEAVFVISAGTNDFVVNYYTVPVRRQSYNVSSYQQFLLQQGLWDEGARKIAVAGLPPMGCLPIVDTFSSNSTSTKRSCIEQYSSVARDYNQMLQTQLNEMQQSSANHGAKIYYVDIYGSMFDMVQYPEKYGYEQVNVGCCGTGYVETSILCNRASTVCTDPSKYVFWDAIHPTEMAYNVVFKDIRSTLDLITGGSSINNSPSSATSLACRWMYQWWMGTVWMGLVWGFGWVCFCGGPVVLDGYGL